MQAVVTKREWLASLNPPLAKTGRGKFSNEAKAAIAKAIAEGMTFSDNAPAPKVVKDDNAPEAEDKPRGVSPENAEVVFENERPYYGMRWYGNENGKRVEVSNRSACMNCGYSLLGHVCQNALVINPKSLNSLEVSPHGP